MLCFRLFFIKYIMNIQPGTDREIQLDEADLVEQNALQTAWNEKDKHYEEKSGVIEVGGQKYQFKVSFIKLRYRGEEDAPFTYGMRRAITEVAPDLEAPHDIVIPVLPGWGETTAQFEGDFLDLLLESLKEAGYVNPKIIGVNACGRGTPEYLEEPNRNRISSISLMQEIDDAENIAEALAGRGYFYKPDSNPVEKPPVVVIGHSMGALNSSAFLNILNHNGGTPGSQPKNVELKVEKLLHMMPAVDGILAMVRWRFLKAVFTQVPKSLKQGISGKGALELGADDYHRIMFGDEKFRDDEQYARSVPDSARRFLQLTLNFSHKFGDVYSAGGAAEGVKMAVWQGGNDKLIPDNAISYLGRLVRDGGMAGEVNIDNLPALSHSIPFRLRGEQREQVRAALKRFLV